MTGKKAAIYIDLLFIWIIGFFMVVSGLDHSLRLEGRNKIIVKIIISVYDKKQKTQIRNKPAYFGYFDSCDIPWLSKSKKYGLSQGFLSP